jgi:hypothetical protein
METASNYDFSSVMTPRQSAGTDVNGDGNTDYLLNFGISFQYIVTQLGTTAAGRPAAISINENMALRFIVATAQNSSYINPDASGVTGLTPPSFVYSDPTMPASLPVPEGPGATLLLAAGLPGGMACYYPTSQRKHLGILVY